MGEIEVVYKDGVFVPLKKLRIKDGTKGVVVLSQGDTLIEIARKHRKKVKEDPLAAFVEERR
ncbi:antitoxin AF2212-like protein [Thermococcus sp.]|uniref:antitoxin family protein n=1 Tax=Thermococcus sp. TaxID=35749 RepID=UPI00261D5EF1|nr:antitoxin AF2212-like protein [Thermococcus sp.]